MSLSEGDNLLLWCGWWDAQTSDSVENPAGVSRARKVWSSSPELETSNRPFYSHHPSISLLSQSVMGTWLDYWGPNGSSFFSRLVDWIRYTFRQQRMMGWPGNQGSIHGFTSQILTEFYQYRQLFFLLRHWVVYNPNPYHSHQVFILSGASLTSLLTSGVVQWVNTHRDEHT